LNFTVEKYGLNRNWEMEAHFILLFQKLKKTTYEEEIELHFIGG